MMHPYGSFVPRINKDDVGVSKGLRQKNDASHTTIHSKGEHLGIKEREVVFKQAYSYT